MLEGQFGTENTVAEMRRNDIPMADEDIIYVWQKADQYIQGWFQENSYRLNTTDIFDDCIGYGCTRRGEEYAVYVYAYGKRRTTMLDGDYCAKLRNYELSKNCVFHFYNLRNFWELSKVVIHLLVDNSLKME